MIDQEKLLIWDFDGTLAYRKGKWSDVVLEVVRVAGEQQNGSLDDIRHHLRAGFPWNAPNISHLHLTDPELWWAALFPSIERALIAAGISPGQATSLAREVRRRYICLDSWQLFDDTLCVLQKLTKRGWTHVILSNHVPELSEIIAGLGLSSHIQRIYSSATIGYEKPHPLIFEYVLHEIGKPRFIYMIGDNPNADILGATNAGIPAILVRRITELPINQFPDLLGLTSFLAKHD